MASPTTACPHGPDAACGCPSPPSTRAADALPGHPGHPGHSTRAARPARLWPAPVGLGIAALAGCVAVGLVGTGDDGPVLCPFRELTGLDCPGCGMTRAVAHVSRGRVGTALDYNLFLVVLIPVLLYLWAAWLAAAFGRRLPPLRVGARGYAIGGVVLAVFGVVRNLPIGMGRYLNSDPLA